jgi:hypothetical protein
MAGRTARASRERTSLAQQWRTPILKRFSERFTVTFTPPRDSGPSSRPKTYNKYLIGVISRWGPTIAGGPLRAGPIMIFAALSVCRICLQITTREMVTQSLLSFSLGPSLRFSPFVEPPCILLARSLVCHSSPLTPRHRSVSLPFRVDYIISL